MREVAKWRESGGGGSDAGEIGQGGGRGRQSDSLGVQEIASCFGDDTCMTSANYRDFESNRD